MKVLICLIVCGCSAPSWALSRLEEAERQLNAVSLSDDYSKGFDAYRKGQIDSARNHWFKYLEKERRLGHGDRPQFKEVESYYSKTARPRVVERPPEITPLPIPTSPEIIEQKKSAKRARVHKKLEKSRNVDVRQILEQAEKAERNGQLDYAHRLYKLAVLSGSNDDRIQQKLLELEKMIR